MRRSKLPIDLSSYPSIYSFPIGVQHLIIIIILSFPFSLRSIYKKLSAYVVDQKQFTHLRKSSLDNNQALIFNFVPKLILPPNINQSEFNTILYDDNKLRKVRISIDLHSYIHFVSKYKLIRFLFPMNLTSWSGIFPFVVVNPIGNCCIVLKSMVSL